MPPFSSRSTLRGHQVGEVVSALQKAIRRSQEEQAVAWAVELDQSGYGVHAWNRLTIITSEDVGIAWIDGPSVIGALRSSYFEAKARSNPSRPERLFIVHAAMLLARAPKSRRVDHAVGAVYGTPEPWFEIPDEALDLHTARGRRMGRGEDHWFAEAAKLVGEATDLHPDPYFDRFMGSSDSYVKTQWGTGGGKSAELVDEPDELPLGG